MISREYVYFELKFYIAPNLFLLSTLLKLLSQNIHRELKSFAVTIAVARLSGECWRLCLSMGPTRTSLQRVHPVGTIKSSD